MKDALPVYLAVASVCVACMAIGVDIGRAKAAAIASQGTVNFTAHDAAGRTKSATATYNSFKFDAGTISIDYTTPQILCSGFEP